MPEPDRFLYCSQHRYIEEGSDRLMYRVYIILKVRNCYYHYYSYSSPFVKHLYEIKAKC